MTLTNYERHLVLVSLNHMEEHLFIIYEAGDMTEGIYNIRMDALKTARTKIRQ